MTSCHSQLLAATTITKRFGGVVALAGASLTVSEASVHGLIGENGSGKSTLLNIISGQVRPDAGVMSVLGKAVRFSSPVEALSAGIAMVSQETALAPHLSVAENVLLGRRLPKRRGVIDWAGANTLARGYLARLGVDLDPRLPAVSLRPDQAQLTEIARALSQQARLLILDEPTSSLTIDESQHLFKVVRDLRSEGVSTIFVSHRLDELLSLTDQLTVLRDGVTVCSGPTPEFDAERLVTAMVGESRADRTSHARRRLGASVGDRQPGTANSSGVDSRALEVRNLRVGAVQADFVVRSGEVLGLAGLVGSGRTEVLAGLFGAVPATGEVQVGGRSLAHLSPRNAVRAGMGYLPPDRKSSGLALVRSASENLTAVQTAFGRRLLGRSLRRERSLSRTLAAHMRVKGALEAPVGTYSGGNQQKVALGKWLANEATVLLLDEPTRGVDVSAKAEIHLVLKELAGRGTAVVVSSSENDELIELCDRVLVMSRWRIAAELTGTELDEEAITHHTGGSK